VTSVESFAFDTLTAEQARLRPGGDLAELRAGLRQHYPDLPDDAEVDVVTFSLESDDEQTQAPARVERL
jgi:cytidine deaminase